MKKSTLLIYPLLLVAVFTNGQDKSSSVYTTSFKVFGACEQCKTRIENAAQITGVYKANWNIDTKQLAISYDSGKVTLSKIEARIIKAGHDLVNKKAKDKVYDKLPECCHYRILNYQEPAQAEINLQKIPDTLIETAVIQQVNGTVYEFVNDSTIAPLAGASITWMDGTGGTATDSNGEFRIAFHPGKIIASYSGYKPDTVPVNTGKHLRIILSAGKQLQEVVVKANQRSSYYINLAPLRTQVISAKELLRAACCNLGESFETNSSVDVTYNDALTGSKQIQLLGLAGVYTQLTIDNLPGSRGLGSPLGLNAIPGPWIEAIQLSKGTGSVVSGSESIAGQINVQLKRKDTTHKAAFNIYSNKNGKTDLNLVLSPKIDSKWSTILMVHDDFLTRKVDDNSDGFKDEPTGNLFTIMNSWSYSNRGVFASLAFRYFTDNRSGGEMAFDPEKDKLTTNHYGLGIESDHLEFTAKIGYVFPQKKYRSIGFQLAAIRHQNESFFGLKTYEGEQETVYGNLIYQLGQGKTKHQFRTGLSFQADNYKEEFNLNRYNRKEIIPGAFFEYTYTPGRMFMIVPGVRFDHNSLFGFIVTPRVHVRIEPVTGTVIRISSGKGQRSPNIFADNLQVFVSSRQVGIRGSADGKAYGLGQEIAWTNGISIDKTIRVFKRIATISLDYFHSDFSSQVIADLEDPRFVNFYNLEGKSFSNSTQLELVFEPLKKLELRVSYRHHLVKTSYHGNLLEKPLFAKDRALATLHYKIKNWTFDLSSGFFGKKRLLPELDNYLSGKERYSPSYILFNTLIFFSIRRLVNHLKANCHWNFTLVVRTLAIISNMISSAQLIILSAVILMLRLYGVLLKEE
jgi:outer membrane receptor for ferrienterochelin and colicins